MAFIVAVACLLPMAGGSAAFARDAAPKVIDVGPAWAGTRVPFNAVYANDRYFVAYYDDERWMTLAVVEPKTGEVRRLRMASQYGGFDSHNEVTLAVDKAGRVHIVGNMHASPLNYFVVDPPYTTIRAGQMLGRDEGRVTYPILLKSGDDILFVYRDGMPGDGRWLANRWNGASWVRATTQPLLGDRTGGNPVSSSVPYLAQGEDGVFRIAMLWRAGPQGVTNYKVTFASSKDFITWTDSAGRTVPLPLTPDNTEAIVTPGQNQGLGQLAMASDRDGNLLLRVRKTTGDGKLGIYLARRRNGVWDGREVAVPRRGDDRPTRLPLESNPAGADLFIAKPSGDIVSCLGPKGTTGRCQAVDHETFAPVSAVWSPERWIASHAASNPDIERPLPLVVPARDARLQNMPNAYLVWVSERLTRDRARECRRVIVCKGDSTQLRLVLY